MSSQSDASFFAQPANPLQRRYEVLRAFCFEGLSAEAVARRFGYAIGSVYAMTRDFRRLDDPAAFFFRPPEAPGRVPVLPLPDVRQRVIELRKANLSLPDIKARLDAELRDAPSLRAIGHVLREEGFQRLPRRTRAERAAASTPRLRAPASVLLDPRAEETFQSERAAGTLCLLPWIRRYGLDTAIAEAGYPGTRTLPALQSVLAFVALKLSDARRYSADDLWCMDRGLGLFAGLNVLPKTASLSSYSDRTTRAMNQRLLGALASIWTAKGLAGDSANLDFTTLPHFYVGESEAGERQGVRRAGAREALRRERSDRSKASLAPAGLPPPLLPPSRRGAARCPPRLPQALRRLRRSRLRPRHRLVPGSLLPRVPAPQAGAVLPLQLPHPLGRAGHPLLW